MLNSDIYKKIAELTPGQRKVAEYISGNSERVVYQTIAQIAKESGVSETTVIRFSYAMGFQTFSDMLTTLQNERLQAESRPDPVIAGIPENANPYQAIIRKDVAALQDLEHRLDYEEVETAAKLLADADLVYSIGFRISSFAASWFASNAQTLRPNVRCLSSQNYSYSSVIDANERTAALAILYSRYSKQTVLFANHIKSKGGKIVLITDSLSSPLADKADHVFLAPSNRTVAQFNCMPMTYTLMNILLQGIIRYRPDYMRRLKAQDALIAETNNVIE